ncbi:hypothetical protein F5Y16DRAFT_399288 [Xylariaceae sp. FL0255]|nr:hypothetical protein F5Y16DRAFT_399288 [Xylariaceae sp. FL0255]
MASSKNAWTEGEEKVLLIRIINQMVATGAKYDLNEIHMEGRTTKALRHAMQRLRGETSVATSSGGTLTPGATTTTTNIANTHAKKRGRAARVSKDEAKGDHEDNAPVAKKARVEKAEKNGAKEEDDEGEDGQAGEI